MFYHRSRSENAMQFNRVGSRRDGDLDGLVCPVRAGDGTVSQYNIQSDNSLAPMNPAAAINPGMKTMGVMPSAAILDPTGSFLYVANSADDTVSQFRIGSDGLLSPLAPAAVSTGRLQIDAKACAARGTCSRRTRGEMTRHSLLYNAGRYARHEIVVAFSTCDGRHLRLWIGPRTLRPVVAGDRAGTVSGCGVSGPSARAEQVVNSVRRRTR
jgi:hypothetical protein